MRMKITAAITFMVIFAGCAGAPVEVKHENVLAAQAAPAAVITGRPDPASLPKAVTLSASAVIFKAASAGDAEALKAAIAAGTDLEVKTDDALQMTALMKAAEAGKEDAVKLLVESGAKVNTISRFGFTALMFASRAGSAGSVKYLLEKGADVSVVGHMWATASGWAANDGIRNILKNAGAK